MNTPTRILFLGALLTTGACLCALPAVADEIVVRDLDTGQESTISCHEVTSETWSEVKYKERKRSPTEKSVDTLTVVRISRGDKSANAASLASALADLDRGNYKEAARALHGISGGGWKVDLETGERKYVSFSANDPTGKNKRAPWISEYSHFYYAKAKFLHGKSAKDRDAVEEAYLALDDVAVPGGEGKTGGFLGRFDGGNSRFYPEAMTLKGQALVQLARYDEAAKVFTDLHKAAMRIPLDPVWAYEGLVGGGMIAEAKGDLTAAVTAYRGAIPTLEVLLEQETRNFMRQRYGRFYSQARMRVASVKLRDAEQRKAPAAFSDLRNWIKGGMPDAIRSRAKSKGLPPESVAALVSGARDPAVQAVGYNGIGLAYLHEPKPKYEDAMLAFKAVTVKYFQVPAQHARALYYLSKAADGAAKSAKGEVKEMYAAMADQAMNMLRSQHPSSEWASKGG